MTLIISLLQKSGHLFYCNNKFSLHHVCSHVLCVCVCVCVCAVIIDRDQSKNMGVENATYQVGPFSEHYEFLELYNTGDRYTIR